jgi:branched-chain amino acid aminotransferase
MKNISGTRFFYDNQILPVSDYSSDLYEAGETIYEVIGFQNGRFFFMEDHIDRLFNSSSLANLKQWLSRKKIIEIIQQVPEINQVNTGSVNIIFNFSGKKHYLAYFIRPSELSEDDYLNGIPVGLLHAERITPNIKFYNMSFRRLADKAISDQGVREVILINREGYVTEGSRSNIFLIQTDKLFTPPLKDVLPGITRKYINRICETMGYEVIEKSIAKESLATFNGAFITGTISRVAPVKRINEIHYQTDLPLIRSIRTKYNEEIEHLTGTDLQKA